MANLKRNFYEGTPRQWELFDTEQLDSSKDQNIKTSETVQNILENNEQTTPKPIDSVQQATRQKVNSIRSGVQEFPMTIRGIHITYLHRAKKIGENEATLTFRYNNKELRFSVTFERKTCHNFHEGSHEGSLYTHATNIELKRPENFDGRHLVRNAKSGRGEYFDFKIAEKIAQAILNDPRFI